MRRHFAGKGSAPAAAFATRHRDGPGPRLRLLRTGARSSLTERLTPHEKRGPGREIAAPERCEARLSRREAKTEYGCAQRRSGPSVRAWRLRHSRKKVRGL
jgi:hypothetical protein